MKILFFFIAFIFLRALPRILHGQIVSEDARTFLTAAFEHSYQSLFQPYAGYFHTLPRILSLLASQLPILWAPWVLSLPCLFIFAFLCYRVTQNDFSEFAKTFQERFFWGLLLSLLPGLFEVLGNPTNIHWVLSLYLALLGLRNIDARLKFYDVIFVFLALSSSGEALALLALFVPRFLLNRKINKANRDDLFIIAGLLIFGWINMASRESGPGLHFSFFKKLPSAFTYLWNNWLLLEPLVGDHATHLLGEKLSPLYWLLSLSLSLLIFSRLFKARKKIFVKENILPLGFILSLIAMLGMIWIARDEAFGIFNQITRDAGYSQARYSFLIGAAALLLHFKIWPLLFQNLPSQKWAPLFFILTLITSSHRFILSPHQPLSPSWSEKLNALKNNPCAAVVEIECWPQGWFLKVPATKLSAFCPSTGP